MKNPRHNPLLFVELAVWLLLVCVTLSTLPDYGASWDEQIRFDQGAKKWDYYGALLSGEHVSPPKDHYPGLHDMLHVGIVRALSLDWILAGHLLSLCFGLLGAWAVRLTAVAIAGRTAAIVSLVVLILGFPRLYGHFFINPKDVPFFAGYAWSVFFLVKIALRKETGWSDAIGWGIATGVALGVRIGGLLLWGYAGLLWSTLIMCWYFAEREKSAATRILARAGRGALRLAVAAGISLLILFVVWPALHSGAASQATATAATVQDFDWNLPVLFGGHYYEGPDLPFFYLPWMFLITTSLPVLVVLAVGAGWSASILRRIPGSFTSGRGLALGVLVFAALFPILYVVLSGATVYNGVRHLLFVIAPLAGLASVLSIFLCRAVAARSSALAIAVAGAGLAVLLLPVIAMVRLHPYQYIYYNELVGGVRGAEGRYELEYWGTAYKEAMEALVAKLDAEETAPGTVFVVGTEHVPWLLHPYLPEGRNYALEIRRAAGPDADFYLACTISEADRFYFGDIIATVERAGATLAVVKDRRNLTGAQREMFYGEEGAL